MTSNEPTRKTRLARLGVTPMLRTRTSRFFRRLTGRRRVLLDIGDPMGNASAGKKRRVVVYEYSR